MKRNKIIYWITTVLAMLTGASTAFMYFTSPKFIEGYKHLGFPGYFRIELGIAKIVGLFLILIPTVPARIKEWAYVGFGITFTSAIIAHGIVDGPGLAVIPLIPLVLLIISYVYYHKVKSE
ncbi:DoxX-like protein [Mucilaginibacter oryzae]|uniref:DoxX-like protein n=1 Tax=Mucilaginibacter oryzae TaxID=468058 RepID=A0A316H9X2_9SPHI|nr:DoxX family protein [Mucilaginibacter oryzae]PWK77258.1 DoxX-like protein [Mucilaginibacter oryzae]